MDHRKRPDIIVLEEFVDSVGKAFYTDEIVVILNFLMREKFVKESELAARLQITDKIAKEAVSFLMDSELLISFENIEGSERRVLSRYSN